MRRRLLSWMIGRLKDTGGTNLIEAAIMTPLLLLLTFGIVDFASLFYIYLALENGVSQATRYGITGQTFDGMTHEQSMIQVFRNATPTLTLPDTAFSFYFMPLGGSSWTPGDGGPNDVEEMQVVYTWTLMTPLMKPFFPAGCGASGCWTAGQIMFTVDSAAKNEPPVNPNGP